MKDLLFILVVLVLISACSQTTKKIEKTEAEKYGLKGKVKSIRVCNFKAKENFGINVLKDGKPSNNIDIFKYGEDSCLKFAESGHIVEREWLPYDDNGQYIKDASKFKSANLTTLRLKYIYTHNKLTGKISTFCDGSVRHDNYVYLNDGKLDSTKICWKQHIENCGCRDIFTKYEYGANGFSSSETLINNGGIISNNIFICDKNGNIIEDKEYGYNVFTKRNGDLISTKNYKYDELNRVISEKTTSNPPDTSSEIEIRYEYNKNDKIALKEYRMLFANSQEVATYNYLYDNNNDLFNTIISSKQGVAIESYKYTYDNMNNWIKKTEYINDKPTTIIERSIEYF